MTCRIWCSRYGRVNKQARSPFGWCSAGMAGVEPAFTRFWRPGAYPLAHPEVNETAPGTLSPGRLPYGGLVAYMATVLVLRAASSCEDGFIYPARFAAVQNVMNPW